MKDDTSISILLADVSGHGIGAALIGSMLKVTFASQVENLSDPAKVLAEINRVLRGKIEESFVTACSIFVDIANLRLRYASAGHPPSFLWGKSKKEMYREEHTSDSVDRTADQFIEHLFKWSDKSRDSSFEDDLTLIIIDIDSSPSTSTFIVSQQMVIES